MGGTKYTVPSLKDWFGQDLDLRTFNKKAGRGNVFQHTENMLVSEDKDCFINRGKAGPARRHQPVDGARAVHDRRRWQEGRLRQPRLPHLGGPLLSASPPELTRPAPWPPLDPRDALATCGLCACLAFVGSGVYRLSAMRYGR